MEHTQTDDAIRTACVSEAVTSLLNDTTPEDYSSILQGILATGYDINTNESELLLCALSPADHAADNVNADYVALLLSLGAQVASEHSVYESSHNHAFVGGRIYTPKVAQALFDHVMASPHFEVISTHLRGYHGRIDVFNRLASDTDKAALYIRVGKLPEVPCSDTVLSMCAQSGLRGPQRVLTTAEQLAAESVRLKELLAGVTVQTTHLKEQLAGVTEQLAAQTAQTIRLREQLAAETAQTISLKEQLAAETAQTISLKEQLAAAKAIIAQLTSL